MTTNKQQQPKTAIAAPTNPFAKQEIAPTEASATAMSDIERATQEIQSALIIAKKFPRNQKVAFDRIMDACSRPGLADTAIYSYTRGGQEVSGLSIRAAEAIAQAWQNVEFTVREISQGGGVSTVEAVAWDMETNTKSRKVFHVPHVRTSRNKGKTVLTDPRDIYELVANNGARRLRSCILALIPEDVKDAALDQCKRTQELNADVTPEKIKAMIEAFEKEYGITKEHIEKRVGRDVYTIPAGILLSLRRIFQSLRDRMSKPSDWFEINEEDELAQPKTSDIAETTKKVDVPEAKEVEPVEESEEAQPVPATEHISTQPDDTAAPSEPATNQPTTTQDFFQ